MSPLLSRLKRPVAADPLRRTLHRRNCGRNCLMEFECCSARAGQIVCLGKCGHRVKSMHTLPRTLLSVQSANSLPTGTPVPDCFHRIRGHDDDRLRFDMDWPALAIPAQSGAAFRTIWGAPEARMAGQRRRLGCRGSGGGLVQLPTRGSSRKQRNKSTSGRRGPMLAGD